MAKKKVKLIKLLEQPRILFKEIESLNYTQNGDQNPIQWIVLSRDYSFPRAAVENNDYYFKMAFNSDKVMDDVMAKKNLLNNLITLIDCKI